MIVVLSFIHQVVLATTQRRELLVFESSATSPSKTHDWGIHSLPFNTEY